MPNVPRVQLGEGYSIPRIIVGCWQLSEGHSAWTFDRDVVLSGWSEMVDRGLTAFDCADIYTGVEELLGELIRRRRGSGDENTSGSADGATNDGGVQIHTKFVPDRDALPSIDKGYVETIIDRSLRRLGVERLDLVQFYWWDSEVPGCVDTALWLTDLQEQGKIRHLGATNFDVPRLRDLLDAGVPFVSNQVQFSLIDNRPENGLVDFCTERGIRLLCYGTLAAGFLSERWLGAALPGVIAGRSLTKYELIIREFGTWPLFQELLSVLEPIGRRHGASISTVAIRYILDRPGVAAAIVGARNAGHLDATLQAFSLELDDEDLTAIDAVLARRGGPAGDVYELEREPSSDHAMLMRYNLNRGAED